MLLKDGDLLIRKAEANDAKTLCKWWNDCKIMAHAGFPNGLGTSEQAIIKQLLNDDDFNRYLILEIDSLPIGEMSYRNKGNQIAEIGIKICDFSNQEKGFGTKYLKMLINYLFTEMGYQKIILDTNLNNKRAQHVYQKIGFQKVGVRINSWKNQLGELQSSVDYLLTKEEFIK